MHKSKKESAMIPFRFKLDRKFLEMMYFSFVHPTMEYGQIMQGGTYNSNMVKLKEIQVKAMCIVTGATSRSNIANLRMETSWVTFKDNTDQAIISIVYKLKKKSCFKLFSKLLKTQR